MARLTATCICTQGGLLGKNFAMALQGSGVAHMGQIIEGRATWPAWQSVVHTRQRSTLAKQAMLRCNTITTASLLFRCLAASQSGTSTQSRYMDGCSTIKTPTWTAATMGSPRAACRRRRRQRRRPVPALPRRHPRRRLPGMGLGLLRLGMFWNAFDAGGQDAQDGPGKVATLSK